MAHNLFRRIISLGCLASALTVSSAMGQGSEKIEFDVTYENLGLAEDARPTEAQMTLDGVTLTVSAGNHQLNNANKGKAVGIYGNKTGQINADEALTLTFDRDVRLRRMDFNGLKQKDENQPAESARVAIESLDIEFTVTHASVAPDNDKVEAKSGDKVVFKGKKFVVPAGEKVVIRPASEDSRFAFQGITVERVGEDSEATGEPS